MLKHVLSFTLLIFSSAFAYCLALHDFQVKGLFKNKAAIEYQGKFQILKVGDSTSDGLTLLEATSTEAIFEYQGTKIYKSLSNQIGTDYAEVIQPELKIPLDEQGMYRVNGKINRQPIQFLIDTGASMVALNEFHAQSANIDFQKGTSIPVDTASGRVTAFQVQLDRLTIGQITKYNVPAVVFPGSYPPIALLGMSFLNQVQLDEDGDYLTLREK